jgi:RNA polymerase sigma factor (sigma-70 family)
VAKDPLANPQPLMERTYAYVAYRIGAGPEAEDVTSEVFEQALRYRHTYDASRGEPISWLIGIARRCIARSLARRPLQSASVDDGIGATTADIAGEAVDRIELQQALMRLSERDRELLALRYGSDLTAREIARVLEHTTNAVEVALHRALARLRSELLEPGGAATTPRLDPAERPV